MGLKKSFDSTKLRTISQIILNVAGKIISPSLSHLFLGLSEGFQFSELTKRRTQSEGLGPWNQTVWALGTGTLYSLSGPECVLSPP